MAISNYSELATTVANYLHRSDLTAMVPDFISLAEAKINRKLRIRAMENVTTAAVSSSIALPAGFVEMIALTVSQGATTYPLTYIPASMISGVAGSAHYYSLVGDNILIVPASSSQNYTLTYYKKFDALSTGVNWLITNAPDVYLYATLMEAAPYIKDDGRISVWAQLMADSIEQLKSSDRNDRYGDGLVVRVA